MITFVRFIDFSFQITSEFFRFFRNIDYCSKNQSLNQTRARFQRPNQNFINKYLKNNKNEKQKAGDTKETTETTI